MECFIARFLVSMGYEESKTSWVLIFCLGVLDSVLGILYIALELKLEFETFIFSSFILK